MNLLNLQNQNLNIINYYKVVPNIIIWQKVQVSAIKIETMSQKFLHMIHTKYIIQMH
jgi:hypothetical protein